MILRVDAHSFVILRVTDILDVFAVSSEPSQLHTVIRLVGGYIPSFMLLCQHIDSPPRIKLDVKLFI